MLPADRPPFHPIPWEDSETGKETQGRAAFSAPDVFKPWVAKDVINTDESLRLSGLLGPVRLLTIRTVEVE